MVCGRVCLRSVPFFVWACVVLAACLIGQHQCSAAEGGIGAYWAGYRSLRGGTMPEKTGLYLRSDVIAYSAHAPRVVLNGQPVENISADTVFAVIEPTYVLPKKLFGATHAVIITQPVYWLHLSGLIIGTTIEPAGSRFAPGDTILSPFFLGWKRNNFYYNANLAIIIPTGGYDIHRVVNTGRNFWTIDPEFGVTYLNLKTKWDISGVLGYSFNSENHATNYKSGEVLHLDYGIGRILRDNSEVGLLGYAWVQVTPDTGSGALFGAFESRIYGIGPFARWKPDKDSELSFKFFHEFGAKDHLEGNQFVATYKTSF